MKKTADKRKLTRFQVQIVFGVMLLLLWYFLMEPLSNLTSSNAENLKLPADHLGLLFLSYASLILGGCLVILAIANIVGYLMQMKNNG